MSDLIKLLPCPFCGAAAELNRASGESTVKCTYDDCGAKLDGCSSMEVETIAVWNTRLKTNGISISKDALERAASALEYRVHDISSSVIPRARLNGVHYMIPNFEESLKNDIAALEEINKAISEAKE